jgi:Na+-driven multidrug efflux pump
MAGFSFGKGKGEKASKIIDYFLSFASMFDTAFSVVFVLTRRALSASG